jgi:hypothetical protein
VRSLWLCVSTRLTRCQSRQSVAFFALLLLISSGWDVIDKNRPRKWYYIAAVVACLALAMALEYFASWMFSVRLLSVSSCPLTSTLRYFGR